MCIISDSMESRSYKDSSLSSILFAGALAAAASAITAVVVRRKYSRDCCGCRKCPDCSLTQSKSQEVETVHHHSDEVSELSAPFVSEEFIIPLKGFDMPPLPDDKAQASISAVDVLPGMLVCHEEKHNVNLYSDDTEQTFCSVFTTETLEV